MNNYAFRSICIFIILSILPSIVFSQTYGKIFTKVEADSLFGPVVEKQLLEKVVLEEALKKTDKVAMFKILNNKLTILGDKRAKVLNTTNNIMDSTTNYVNSDEIFHTYSKTKLEELLKLGGEKETFVENRADVLTLTNGVFTLEAGTDCPPNCD